MDPISAAASIVGLLGAAAKISEVLLKFFGKVVNAPNLARNVLMEISDVSACLIQLQRYLQGTLSTSSSQEQLLTVEQLVGVLSNCVLIFSELEKTVDSLKPRPWMVTQWLFKEQAISALLIRMQQSKLSLSLMLTTLTCTSIEESQSSANQLAALVQQVLESNLEMSQRMANLEMRMLGYSHSSAPALEDLDINRDDESINTMRAANDTDRGSMPPGERVDTLQETSEIIGKESGNLQCSTFNFTFDQDLKDSRPYARAMKKIPLWSTTSSAVHTMSWSCLSGLSLAQVSKISVINLPISTQELWNGHRYIFADAGLACLLRTTETPVTNHLVSGVDCSLLNLEEEYEKEYMQACKAMFPVNSIHSVDGISAFDTSQQVSTTPSMVGGGTLGSNRVVLLGVSMAGKTTIDHRLQMTHGLGFTEPERRRARDLAILDLVTVFNKVCLPNRDSLPLKDIKRFADLEDTAALKIFHGFSISKCRHALVDLWSNPEIRSMIEDSRDPELNENIFYIMENFNKLFYRRTIPNELLLRGFHKTRLSNNTKANIGGQSCHIDDIGGSRSNRKQWLTSLQCVDTIMFVVSLTGYCQALPEDSNVSQMDESLLLFEDIIKLEVYRNIPIIVFLNKFDLLEQRMKQDPIVDFYPDYYGDSCVLTACRFFADMFLELDRYRPGPLIVEIISAVESDDFEPTIDGVWSDLFQQE